MFKTKQTVALKSMQTLALKRIIFFFQDNEAQSENSDQSEDDCSFAFHLFRHWQLLNGHHRRKAFERTWGPIPDDLYEINEHGVYSMNDKYKNKQRGASVILNNKDDVKCDRDFDVNKKWSHYRELPKLFTK